MATRRKGQHDRAQALLPRTTATGLLTGFVPEDWMIAAPTIYPYRACCQDVTRWAVGAATRPLQEHDPYYRLGYRDYAPMVRCGTEVNAGEYRPVPRPPEPVYCPFCDAHHPPPVCDDRGPTVYA